MNELQELKDKITDLMSKGILSKYQGDNLFREIKTAELSTKTHKANKTSEDKNGS